MNEPVKSEGKRRYDAPRRRQQAAETQHRVLAAARRLFGQRGYAATPITAVAAEAGVSVETVYQRFGSKPGVLSALVASAVDDDLLGGLVEQALTEREPRRQLALVARLARSIYGHSGDIVRLLREAGPANEAAAQAWREADARARQVQAPVVAALAQRGALRDGLNEREAADVLWALAGPDMYRLLVDECGWTGERYEQWLAESLRALLLQDVR